MGGQGWQGPRLGRGQGWAGARLAGARDVRMSFKALLGKASQLVLNTEQMGDQSWVSFLKVFFRVRVFRTQEDVDKCIECP